MADVLRNKGVAPFLKTGGEPLDDLRFGSPGQQVTAENMQGEDLRRVG